MSVETSLARPHAADAPIRVIRPVAVPAHFLVAGPLFAGFLAIFPAFFAFLLSNMIAGGFDPTSGPITGPAGVVYGLAFATVFGLVALKVFVEPGRTTYAVYPDRIEFAEGLLNRAWRTVLLDGILDVQLTEGVLQQTVGAGSISLVTPQLVGRRNALSHRTFTLSNVPDPVGVYDLIRSLAGRDGGMPRRES